MTYGELLAMLTNMTPEQLVQDVTVHEKESDEYYQADGFEPVGTGAEDILDPGHYIIRI